MNCFPIAHVEEDGYMARTSAGSPSAISSAGMVGVTSVLNVSSGLTGEPGISERVVVVIKGLPGKATALRLGRETFRPVRFLIQSHRTGRDCDDVRNGHDYNPRKE